MTPEYTHFCDLAIETGLRAKELRSLMANNFNFELNTVTVKADDTKIHKKTVLPMRGENTGKNHAQNFDRYCDFGNPTSNYTERKTENKIRLKSVNNSGKTHF